MYITCSGGVDGAHPAKCPCPAGVETNAQLWSRRQGCVLGGSPCDTLINQSEIVSWDGGGPGKYARDPKFNV